VGLVQSKEGKEGKVKEEEEEEGVGEMGYLSTDLDFTSR